VVTGSILRVDSSGKVPKLHKTHVHSAAAEEAKPSRPQSVREAQSHDLLNRGFSFGLGSRFLPGAAVVRVSENDAGFFVLVRFLAVVRLIVMARAAA
jgi:hypothetical protein